MTKTELNALKKAHNIVVRRDEGDWGWSIYVNGRLMDSKIRTRPQLDEAWIRSLIIEHAGAVRVKISIHPTETDELGALRLREKQS